MKVHLLEEMTKHRGIRKQFIALTEGKDQIVKEASCDHGPDNQRRFPESAQPLIAKKHEDDKNKGETQVVEGTYVALTVDHHILHAGSEAERYQEQDHGHHTGGKELLHMLKKSTHGKNGYEQSSDHHGGVDLDQPKTPTCHDADDQDR